MSSAMREYLIALLFFGCATTPSVAPVVTKASAPAIAALDETAAYIDAPVSGKSIVLLGELRESLGYDVLAVEGSALDAWLAQDDLYRGMSIEDASREAWLMLWNTDAMRAVLRYARDSRMYLASMDIQPAMGGGPKTTID
jgi:hypothetical protein